MFSEIFDRHIKEKTLFTIDVGCLQTRKIIMGKTEMAEQLHMHFVSTSAENLLKIVKELNEIRM